MLKMTKSQFHTFIKPGALPSDNEHYLTYFDQYQKTGKKLNWNWAAFIFNEVWFLYRKMYMFGILLFAGYAGFMSVLKKALISLGMSGGWKQYSLLLGVGVLYRSALALYADYIYLDYIGYQIYKGKKPTGVNNWVARILVIINIIWLLYAIFEEVRGTA